MCVFQGCEAGQGHSELELLQQENEALKAQMARLSTQLLDVSCDTNQCSLILLLLWGFFSNVLFMMMIINFIFTTIITQQVQFNGPYNKVIECFIKKNIEVENK